MQLWVKTILKCTLIRGYIFSCCIAVDDAIVKGSVRRSHSAVFVKVLMRPRSLQGLQQVQVSSWPEMEPGAEGKLECDRGVWEEVLVDEARTQGLEVSSHGVPGRSRSPTASRSSVSSGGVLCI